MERAKERYNAIISAIEQGILDWEVRPIDLVGQVARTSAMTPVDLNTVLSFLTGRTAITYIKHRRMMAAYQHLISTEPMDISGAVEISGYDNQSSFDKKFRATFQMTPGEAFRKKDPSLYEAPMTWEVLSEAGAAPVPAESLQPVELPEDAASLQVLYAFSQDYVSLAKELVQLLKVFLKDAFEFVDSARSYLEETDAQAEGWDSGEEAKGHLSVQSTLWQRMRDMIFDAALQFLFFRVGVSVALGMATMKRVTVPVEEFIQMDPWYVREFIETPNMTFANFKKACDYFERHSNPYPEFPGEEIGESDEYIFEHYLTNLCAEMEYFGYYDYEAALLTALESTLIPTEETIESLDLSDMLEREQAKLGLPDPYEDLAAENDRWLGLDLDQEPGENYDDWDYDPEVEPDWYPDENRF